MIADARNEPLDRLALLDLLLPACEPHCAAFEYPQGKELGIGWVKNLEDAQRAIAAYRAGTLAAESFNAINEKGKKYVIREPQRLGVVLHRDGMVFAFCADLDNHSGDGGNVHLFDAVARFFGAAPIVFTSRSGSGLHCFFRLREPIEVNEFKKWAKAWGFNRPGDIELFPKSEKKTQTFLPNEPNDRGGDDYVSGTPDSWIVDGLPKAPTATLTTTTLRFLRGFVSEGSRNDALNKAAFELGGKRAPRNEAWRLCSEGARLCGLDIDEVKTTFASGFDAGSGRAPGHAQRDEPEIAAPITIRPLDGIGDGERFKDAHGADVRYCYPLKSWFGWDGKRWSTDAQCAVERMATESARAILAEMDQAIAVGSAEGRSDKELRSLRKKYIAQYEAAARVPGMRQMLTMAQSRAGVAIAVGQLDADPMLLNVANGTLDLRTGELRPHRREDLITKMAGAAHDVNASCPLWERFLDRIFGGDEQLIAYMQRAVGYSLTGSVDEQCLFFNFGSGQNGKSVFMQTILSVFGDYAQKAPTEMIMKQTKSSSGGATPDMARLRGVRLAVTAELEEGQRMGEARVKDLTGGDRINARALYASPIEFDPTHKLWIYGNHKPTIRGTDEGIWRRMRLIPFTVTIPDDEKDPKLIEKLSRERDAILVWALRGCLEWHRDGLGTPHIVVTATQDYRSESDLLAGFFDELCALEGTQRVAKGALYDAHKEWCEASGEQPMSKKKFGQLLVERGFKEERTGRQRFWLGIGLREEGDSHAQW